MEDEQPASTLPDELVELIIAFLPYPSLFKARCLSKSWQVKFSHIGSLTSKAEKDLAASFQRVRERSIHWEPFFPVCLGNELSFAYSWTCQDWVSFPSLGFLEGKDFHVMPSLCVNGPLICRLHRKRLCVANIFTRKWRNLPSSPNLKEGTFGSVLLVSDTSLESYKVILFYEDGDGLDELEQQSAVLYDSTSDSWRSTHLVKEIPMLGSPVYLDGRLYVVASFDLRHLLRMNLEEGTSETLKLKFHEIAPFENVDLVVCNGKLLLIVDDLDSPETVHVLQIDLESLELLLVTRGPPAALKRGRLNIRRPVAHGVFIFFGMYECDNPKLAYNTQTNEWTCFRFTYPSRSSEFKKCGVVTFQPPLNLFMDV